MNDNDFLSDLKAALSPYIRDERGASLGAVDVHRHLVRIAVTARTKLGPWLSKATRRPRLCPAAIRNWRRAPAS